MSDDQVQGLIRILTIGGQLMSA